MSASPTNTNLGLPPSLIGQPIRPGILPPRNGTPSGHDTLQALLAFSALNDEVRQQRKLGWPTGAPDTAQTRQFALDEVLQLVAERAAAMTGADGIAIALAEGDAIICRAATGEIAPDTKAKLNPNSGFSGACFRSGKMVRCDDAENDPRVNVQAARRLGVRSMVAVPLTGKHGTLGLLEAFSSKAFGFGEGDIRSLNLLAELILAAMKPEEESRMAEISQQLSAATAIEEPPAAIPAADNEPSQAEVPASQPEVAVAAEPVEATPVPEELLRGHFLQTQPERTWPGIRIVSLLVVVALVLGAGLWWRLRSAPSSAKNLPSALATQPQQITPAAELTESAAQERSTKAEGLTAVTGVRQWSSPDATTSTVVIDLEDEVQYESHPLTDPERIYFDLHDTSLPRSLFKNIEVGDGLLVRVRVGQPAQGVTRVVLETKNNPNPSVSMEQSPHRLVVQLRSANAPARPRTSVDLFAPGTPAPVQAPTRQAANQPALRVPVPAPAVKAETSGIRLQLPKFRIALDAGHGGWDEGTIGRRGLMEKDLALDVVARLGKILTDRAGAEVIYTRTEDTYVALEKRAEIANLAQADLFISIHANYSDVPSARGVETYFTNTYSSLNARTPTGDPTLTNVNWTNVDVRDKAQQSQRLAASVQKALYGKLARENPGLRDRGVKKASYVVLTGTTMPAILAEVSFVSSPADEKNLKSATYRQRIAEALYRGISRYAAEHHRVTMASTSARSSGQ